MGVTKDVNPFPVLLVPEISPDDDALVGCTTFGMTMISYLTDSDHSIARKQVGNMVDLTMDRLQAGKESLPTLADLVMTLIEFAVRRDEEDIGAVSKQVHHFVGVEQSMSFEQLSVQFLVCCKNVGRQCVRLRVHGYATK